MDFDAIELAAAIASVVTANPAVTTLVLFFAGVGALGAVWKLIKRNSK